MSTILVGFGAFLAIVALSYVVESRRRAPVARARVS